MRSAVNTVARLLGSRCGGNRGRCRRPPAAAGEGAACWHGMSLGRWTNVALLWENRCFWCGRCSQPRIVGPRCRNGPDPGGPVARRRDLLFARWRTRAPQGIGPAEVTLRDLEGYGKQSCTTGCAATRRKPGTPSFGHGMPATGPLRVGPRSRLTGSRRVLHSPWSAFPPSLQVDVHQFRLRQSGKISARTARHGRCGRPASKLVIPVARGGPSWSASVRWGQHQHPIDPRPLLTVENFKRILASASRSARRQPNRPRSRNGDISDERRAALAEIQRRNTGSDAQIAQIEVNLSWRGMTAKNRERLRPFNDDSLSSVSRAVPSRIRASIERSKLPPRRRALLAQRAAAIAILLVAPIRMKNLINLDVERHLILRGGLLYLVVPEHEVKNEHPIDFELPADTAGLVAWYVREHSGLACPPFDCVVSRRWSYPNQLQRLAAQIYAAVFQHTGLKVNVHLFRHIAAKTIWTASPATISRFNAC